MSVYKVEGSAKQANAVNYRTANLNVDTSDHTKKSPVSSKEDDGIKLSISREGMESYRKNLQEKGSEKITAEKKTNLIKGAKQAANALLANNYGYELAKDSVRAYGNLYDEIWQGYQNGTRERYIEDETSETGYRKMTMAEELSRLDEAFQKAATNADTKEMIAGEFERLKSKATGTQIPLTDKSQKPQTEDNNIAETAGEKMKKLAQAWKDAYRASGSKENAMEQILSMMNGMFHVSDKN